VKFVAVGILRFVVWVWTGVYSPWMVLRCVFIFGWGFWGLLILGGKWTIVWGCVVFSFGWG